MATWVRNGTGTLPSATNASVTGTIELDNGTAPADFDVLNVNSVRIEMRTEIGSGTFQGGGAENHDVWNHALLTLNGAGTTVADVNAADGVLDDGTNGGSTVDLDGTDVTISAAHSIAEWEGTELNPGTSSQWTLFNQNMGPDGVLVQIASTGVVVTVTIDYDPLPTDYTETITEAVGVTDTTIVAPTYTTRTVDLTLTPTLDPVSTFHKVKVRMRGSPAGGNAIVKLLETSTQRASFNPTVTTSWVEYSYTLTVGEANSITDYSDLHITIEEDPKSTTGWLQVSWVEVELVAPAGGDTFETVTDPVGVTDATLRVVEIARTITDPVGVIDDTTPVKTIQVTVNDPVGVIDDTLPVKAVALVATDPVGVTDTTSRIATFVRSATDPVGVIDATTQAEENAEASVEPVGITDQTSRVWDAVRVVTDAVGVTDIVASVKTITELVTDAVGVADQTIRVVPFIRTATDPVGVADVVLPVKAIAVTIPDPVGVTDVVTTKLTKAEISTDAVGVTDQTSRVVDFVRTVTESVGVIDATTQAEENAEASVESVGVIDDTPRVVDYVREIGGFVYAQPDGDLAAVQVDDSQPFGNADGLYFNEVNGTDLNDESRYVEIALTGASDVGALQVSLSDLLDPGTDVGSYMLISLTEVVFIDLGGTAVTGNFVLRQGATFIHNEFPSGNGSAFQTHELLLVPAVTANITDWTDLNLSMTVTSGINHVGTTTVKIAFMGLKTPTQVNVADVVTPAKAITVTVTDDVGVTDNTSRVHTAERTVTDPVGVVDQVLPAKAIVVTINDPVGITDNTIDDLTSGATDYFETSNEPVGITDDTPHVLTVVRTITDPIGVADLTSTVKVITATVNDPVGVADQVLTQLVKAEIVTDPVGITDNTSRIATFVRTVTESVGAIDATTQAEENAEASVENVGVTDNASRQTDVKRTIGGRDTFTDDFNRADSTSIGAQWVEDGAGDAEIVSNQMRLNADNNTSIDIQTAAVETAGDNHKVEVTYRGGDPGTSYHRLGLIARSDGGSNYVAATYATVDAGQNDRWKIWSVVDDVWTATGAPLSTQTAPTSGDVIRLEVVGLQATLYVNDVSEVTSVIETQLVHGRHVGLVFKQTAASAQYADFDDFLAEDLAGVDITDQVLVAKTADVTVTDPVGVTDSVLVALTATRTVTDPVGVIDATLEAIVLGILRPITDISAAGWDTAPTASENLWEQLDEVTLDTSDYIFAETP